MKFLISFICIFLLSTNTYSAEALTKAYNSSQSKLFLIGESHLDDYSRDIFKDSLSSFKSSHGEVLALEMIESSKQYLLDNYAAGIEESETELASYLDVRWRYNTMSYMNLIKRAKDLELQLLAVDLDKKLWPQETTIFPVVPDISKVRAAREDHMAKILCENSELKTALIIGSIHTLDRFLPIQLKQECYLSSKSIRLKTILTD